MDRGRPAGAHRLCRLPVPVDHRLWWLARLEQAGAKIERDEAYPGWKPNPDSAIVNKTLYYEAGVFSDPGYKMQAVFMASTAVSTVA